MNFASQVGMDGNPKSLCTRNSRFRPTPTHSLDQPSSRSIVEYGDIESTFLAETSNDDAFNLISNTSLSQDRDRRKHIIKTNSSVFDRLGPRINDFDSDMSNTGYGRFGSSNSEPFINRNMLVTPYSSTAFSQLPAEQEHKHPRSERKRRQNYEDDNNRKKKRLSDTNHDKIEISDNTCEERNCEQFNPYEYRQLHSFQFNNRRNSPERNGRSDNITQYRQDKYISFQSSDRRSGSRSRRPFRLSDERRSRSGSRRPSRNNDQTRSRLESPRSSHKNDKRRSRSGSHGLSRKDEQKRSRSGSQRPSHINYKRRSRSGSLGQSRINDKNWSRLGSRGQSHTNDKRRSRSGSRSQSRINDKNRSPSGSHRQSRKIDKRRSRSGSQGQSHNKDERMSRSQKEDKTRSRSGLSHRNEQICSKSECRSQSSDRKCSAIQNKRQPETSDREISRNSFPQHHSSTYGIYELPNRKGPKEIYKTKKMPNHAKNRTMKTGLETAKENINIELLNTLDLDSLVLHLYAHNNDLDTFLWREDIIQDLSSFLAILGKVCLHDSEMVVQKIIKTLTDGRNFFARNDVQSLITNMSTNFKAEDIQVIKCILQIFTRMPCQKDRHLASINLLLDSLELTTIRHVDDSTQKDEIFEMIKSAKNGKGTHNDTEKRLDNILKILPNLDEIDSMLTLQNITDFKHADEYLQQLFLVHRQDFIVPLCRGLKCLKNDLYYDPECLQRRWRNDDVRVFKGIQFVVRCCSEQDGITVKVSFDVTQYRRVNWKFRKILMYGSLVCLVDKDFTFLQYATVSCRDELGFGLLDVKTDKTDELVNLLLNKSNILLVESQAFYPSYFHTLNSIKETYEAIKENNYSLPLSKELLAANTKPDLPDYFEAETFKKDGFDLSCICNSLYQNIDISNEGHWPYPSTIGLDDSQYQAMVSSMKSKLALIQGPPGTGKTVVGLKMAEVLIHNEHVWRNSTNENIEGPILLLSFTNHALDQFLLDILKRVPQLSEDGNIVRLGSKSEVEELKKLNLTVLRREKYTYRREERCGRRGRTYYKTVREIKSRSNIAADETRKNLKTRQVEHENLKKMKKELHTGIVHTTWLYRIAGVMTDNHYCQLSQNGSICEWLDLLSFVKKEHYGNEEDVYENDSYDYIDEEFSLNMSHEDDPYEDEIEIEKMHDMFLDFEKLIMEVPYDLRSQSKQSKNNQNPFWTKFKSDEKILFGQFIRDKLHYTKAFDFDTLDSHDVWRLCIEDRWRLYKYWIEQASIPINKEIEKCENSFEMAHNRYLEIQSIADSIILQNAVLVACTTTRAARDINILRQVSPTIILMEEAAEIPEHHVIASLTSSCQQLIMIGDHQQLRPSFNDYKTAKKYNLNISLFERLINNGHPYKQLKYQHRMRPSFSRLLVPCIYKCLYDDDSVLGREHVKGMQKDLFFISHSAHEDSDREELSRSHKNTHEATYIGQLYKYLRLQGYMASEITVLCTYLDQVRLLRSIIKPIEDRFDANEQKTRITSVDNFQGEENDIILLSLVRSNEMGKIGYLHEANRICVALSRAKIGLYVIGNFEQLAARSKTWENILKKAKEDGHMGFDLDLVCTKHNNVTTIKRLEDFHQVVDGGCQEPCGYRRVCGHFCSRNCHTNDTKHIQKCEKPCKLKCKEGDHECLNECHHPFPCEPCKELVEKRIPVCGHDKKLPCHLDPTEASCDHRCNKIIGCGHVCQKRCTDICTTEKECNELIKTEAVCGHERQVACRTKYNPPCRLDCGAVLRCGHKCRGKCSDCSQGRLHVPCQEKCKRVLVCGHMCTHKCNINCPPCEKKCGRKCSHYMDSCEKLCKEPCIQCHEDCQWRCHPQCPNKYDCDMRCIQPCARPKCNTPCNRILHCKHKCSGLMCEKCNDALCKTCNNELTQLFYGNEDESDAVFIMLEDCNCTFEVRDLDKYVATTIESIQEDGIRPLKCPRCTVIITKSTRYTNELKLVNKLIQDVYRAMSENERIDLSSKKRILRQNLSIEVKIEKKEVDKLNKDVDRTKSILELNLITNRIAFIRELASLRIATEKLGESYVKKVILARIRGMKDWTCLKRSRYSDQEHLEFNLETRRLRLMVHTQDVKDQILRKNEENLELPENITECLNKLQSPTEIDHDEISRMRSDIDAVSSKILGLTFEEKKMIKQAMADVEFRGSGHWYKCKNGHMYSIGECGMPMEQRKCPVCDSTIGGHDHLLNNDNDRDAEMENL